MDLKNMGAIVGGLVVAIIMLTIVLMPIVGTTTAETMTYTNEGMPFDETADGETHTITVNSTAITVDGETVDQSLFPSGFNQFTILYGNPGMVRYDVNTLNIRTLSNNVVNISFANGETITISIDGTGATISSSDESVSSVSVTGITHFISTSGDAVMVKNPVVNSTSTIIGEGQTSWAAASTDLPKNLDVITYWTGTMADVEATVLKFWSASDWSTMTVDSDTVNTTDLGNGLYRIDSVLIDYTATLASDSSEHEVTSTYTYFLAPAEIEYDNPNYAGETEAALLDIAPLLITVGIIIGIVGMAFSRRE